MEIVSTTRELADLCAQLQRDDFVAVDSEFMREQTYWPVLCLIQIAGNTREAIIDPLAEGMDLAPFYALMADEHVLKVFHAARQDIEIIYTRSGVIPKPLFDTQIAAMVCGFGEQVSYEGLVRQLANANIDKSSRFTDWSRRPLTAKQLAYALSDVTHLRTIYSKLKAELDHSGREPWLEEEEAVLTSPATYKSDPSSAWRRLKFRPRNRRQLAVLMSVAAWREREAQSRDVPRNRVLKDDALAEVAVQTPQHEADLKRLRALPKGYATSRFGEALIGAIKEGLAYPSQDLPELEANGNGKPEGLSATVEVLRLALKIVCEAEGIAPKLVASTADLEAIAAGKTNEIPALQGWRYRVFGSVALKLRSGEIDIGLEEGRPVLRVPAVTPSRIKTAKSAAG